MTHPVAFSDLDEDPDSLGLCVSAPADIDILVSAGDWAEGDLQTVLAAAVAALDAQGANLPDVELSINLADDTSLHALNKRYRGRDKPTNILSFATLEPEGVSSALAAMGADSPPLHLGDLAVADGVVAAESAAQNKDRADHLNHLIVHGVLHLLGFDHLTDADADRMEAREEEILASLGTLDPYRERAALHQTDQS